MPIAYHPSVPLHHQIQQVLRSSIEAGEIEPDEQMCFGVDRLGRRAERYLMHRGFTGEHA